MKKRLTALVCAVSLLPVLPLTGCMESGTYETEHFRFTVSTSWYLESAWDLQDNNYRGGMAGPEYEFRMNDGYYVRVYEAQTNRSVQQNDASGTPIDCSACALPAAGYVESENGLNTYGIVRIADKNDSGVQLVVQFSTLDGRSYGGAAWNFPDDVQGLLGTAEQIKEYAYTGGEAEAEGVTLRYSEDWCVQTGLPGKLFQCTLAAAQSGEEADSLVTLERLPEGYSGARDYLDALAKTYEGRGDARIIMPVTDSTVSGRNALLLGVSLSVPDRAMLYADIYVIEAGGQLYALKSVTYGDSAHNRVGDLIFGTPTETLSFTFPA